MRIIFTALVCFALGVTAANVRAQATHPPVTIAPSGLVPCPNGVADCLVTIHNEPTPIPREWVVPTPEPARGIDDDGEQHAIRVDRDGHPVCIFKAPDIPSAVFKGMIGVPP